jgi:hypothetical protein
MTIRISTRAALFGLCILSTALTAETLPSKSPITVQYSPSSITWSTEQQAEDYGLQLTISGPDDWYFRNVFESGSAATFSIANSTSSIPPDGHYKYELISVSTNGNQERGGTEQTETSSRPSTSGAFSIENSAIINDVNTPETTAVKDVTHADDVIIQSSLCVGFDCVTGESFGFDTIRLKENNTRIKFDDTSSTGGFPNHDWQLTANDSANGGLNKFSIEDTTAGRVPFTIEGNAPTNSLYVDDVGKIGIKTSTPAVELHVVDGDTPTLRLEQNGSSGWSPQTWDVAGNETNFFIRDVTNGSQLPFRIKPGAPSNSIYINNSGKVGLGTTTPGAQLHVHGATDGTEPLLLVERTVSGQTENVTLFEIKDSGNATLLKVLAQGSDRNMKKDIVPVNTSEILAKIDNLPVSTWSYKTDDDGVRHLGPMAQDFYRQFQLGSDDRHIAPLDGVGLALAAIQELSKKINMQQQIIEKQQQIIDELRKEN